MIGLELRLSRRIGVDGRSQVYVRLTLGPHKRPVFKSGIYIKPEWMKYNVTGKGKRYYIAPPTGNCSSPTDLYDGIDAKNRMDTLCNLLLRICQITEEHDKDRLTREWVEACYQQIVKDKIAPRDISFAMLDQIYSNHIRKQVLPGNDTYQGNFFKLLLSFKKGSREGSTFKQVVPLARILARFERYIQITDPKRKSFRWDVFNVSKFTILEFKDYMLHEDEYIGKTGKLMEIVKQHPDLPKYKNGYSKKIEFKRGARSLNGYMMTFKAFFNWLIDMEIVDKNPLQGIVREKVQYGIPYYLTISERNMVAEFNFGTDTRMSLFRDVFIFQCHTGCRYGDLSNLTPLNIIDGMLQYYPSKTKEQKRSDLVKVPLSEKAKEIIALYQGSDPKGRLLPFPGLEVMNVAIKSILTRVGITRAVPIVNAKTGKETMIPINTIASSHMARRTFIGAAYKVVKDPNLIGKMSGHIEGSKSFTRYRTIDEEDLKEVISKIE